MSLQPCLFPYAVEGPRREIVAQMTGRSDEAAALGMFQLPVTPFDPDDEPPFGLEKTEHLSNLHGERIAGLANIPGSEHDEGGGLRPGGGKVAPLVAKAAGALSMT